jgi:hypothetical protein
MRQRVSNFLCLYLPTRLRRWYVLGPAYLLIGFIFFVATILVGACFIRCDGFFKAGPLPRDARMQFNHVGDVIRKANQTGRLDIYEGYSSFSGVHAEWIPIFYTFSSMALSEIHRAYPVHREEVTSLLTMCARGALWVPSDVPDEGIPSFLEGRQSTESPLMAGYMGVVLGLRKAVVKDTLFDAATGFTLCTHKLYGSPASFTRIYRLLELLGAPRESGDRKSYLRGNAMGDAILLYAKVAQPRG